MMIDKNNTLVSVLTPVYNAEKFIRETIDSVLSQTLPDFELLLMDDGSTDKSAEIIKSYTDKRIKYIPCSHDFIKTLNHGLDLAKGKYIALLDHDDIMLPQRLKVQYEYMEANPDLVGCGGCMHSFGWYSREMRPPLSYSGIVTQMIVGSPMLNTTGFLRKDALVANNIRYSSGYSFAADSKFWADVVKIGKVVNIPEVLTLYRTSTEQTSIKYMVESREGLALVNLEIVNYLLSLVQDDSKYYSILSDEFLPGLDKLGEDSFFSSKTLFPFMHELIVGLLGKDAIVLDS